MTTKTKLETHYLSEKVGGLVSGKDWLGRTRGSGAAKLNALLLVGATMDELEACRGGVHSHFTSLKKEYGLEVVQQDGVYRFKL